MSYLIGVSGRTSRTVVKYRVTDTVLGSENRPTLYAAELGKLAIHLGQRRIEVRSAGLDRDGARGFDERFLAIRNPAAVYRQMELLKVSGNRPHADGDHAPEVFGRGIPVDRDLDPRILLIVG
ncbi:hypothetical protein BN1708_012815 [Verticillium longisporum]|uniref:Uncharacterized protein n=1 Tax=Verticillium longisporum TaxID=100787 RepID=A0A0G4LF84_VERLO|nr:hypothetical protein BN1708_012815 [Verticillium longisporum]